MFCYMFEICFINFDKMFYILLVFGDLFVELCLNQLLTDLFVAEIVFVVLVGRNICLVFLGL